MAGRAAAAARATGAPPCARPPAGGCGAGGRRAGAAGVALPFQCGGDGAGLTVGAGRALEAAAAAPAPLPHALAHRHQPSRTTEPLHATCLLPRLLACGYDPSKFRDVDRLGDRGMEAG